MFGIIIPIVITGLGAGAFWRAGKKRGVMTPERQKIYQAALGGSLKDPKKLRQLASAFSQVGLTPQADLLNKRAALKEAPKTLKAERREAFRKGMSSKDRQAVMKLATEFQNIGATGAAAKLAAYASGLPLITPPPQQSAVSAEPTTE